jgi:hypothetical protein
MVTQDNNKWYRGHIASWWGLKHRDLDYINEPFNNPDDLAKWKSLGFTQTVFTGDMYDMRNPAPEWYDGFGAYFKDWKNIGWSFYSIRPGTVLPLHSDTYSRYKKVHNLLDSKKIWRAVIFLEKWQSGHYLEIEGNIITDWSAGDYVAWNDDVEHLAANMGTTNRYTLQLTGHK